MNDIPERIIDGHFHSAPGTGELPRLGPEHFEAIFEELPQLECVVTSSAAGVAGSQAQASEETQSVIDAVGPGRVKGSIWIVPRDPAWRDDAEQRLDSGFVALKVHGPLNGYTVGPETVGPAMDLARERNVPVTFHFSDPGGLDELAAGWPEVTMVLFHSGSLAGMKLAKAHANIVLETSVADNFLIEVLVRTIGADRVMYGCDAPLCMCSRRHTAELGVRSYVENLEEICSLDLTRDELATICCHIPGRIYGL